MDVFAHTEPTDFWGVVFPAYLGAVGGILSGLIALIAYFSSLRTKRGLTTVAQGLNEESSHHQVEGVTQIHSHTSGHVEVIRAGVVWSWRKSGRSRYELINGSHTRTATILSAEDITPNGDNAFRLLVEPPVKVGPQASVPFGIDKSFVSPAVTSVRIVWDEEDVGERDVILYI